MAWPVGLVVMECGVVGLQMVAWVKSLDTEGWGMRYMCLFSTILEGQLGGWAEICAGALEYRIHSCLRAG